MSKWTLLLLLAGTAAALEPGRSFDATLRPGGAWIIPVHVDAPGAVTIEVRSFAFDAALELVDGTNGDVVARDDDGGIVRDARLVIELTPARTQTLTARVTAANGRGGPFTIEMSAGDVPLPGEPAGATRAVHHFVVVAEECREEGNVRGAAQMLLQAGEVSFKVGLDGRGREQFAAVTALDVPPLQAMAEARLALLANEDGELESAIAHATRAMVLAREAELAEFEVDAALQLAIAHQGRQEFAAAEVALIRARDVAEQCGNVPQRRRVLAGLAPLFGRRSAWGEAHANAVEWAALAEDEDDRSEALSYRAEADLGLGRTLEARDAFERVLAEDAALGSSRRRVRATLGLAAVRYELDDLPGAIELLVILEQQDDLDPLWQAQSRQLHAICLGMMGHFDRAEELMTQASSRFESANAPRLSLEALINLAFLRQEAGRIDEAHSASATALETAERLGDDELLARGEAMHAFSSFLAGRRDTAERLARSSLGRLTSKASAGLRLINLEIIARNALFDDRLDDARDTLRRAGELLDTPQWNAVDPDTASRLRAGRRLWNWGEISLGVRAVEIESLSGAERRIAVEAALTENGAWKARALRETIADRSGAPPIPTPHDLRSILDERDAVLDFANGIERSFVFVLTRAGLDLLDLGPRVELEEDVDRLVGLFARNRASDLDAVVTLSGDLHRRLVAAPFAAVEADPSRLIVSPVGALERLPFEALVVSRTENSKSFADVTFQIESRHVSYVPSTPVLWMMARRAARTTGGVTLLLADPLYCREAGAESPRADGPFERLVGTQDEARAILKGLGVLAPPGDRTWSLEEEVVEAFTGRAATMETLKRRGDWSRYDVLHLAAHGVADERNPRQTGLVLAGDRLLSVEDVLRLELDADVTVLSACETGRGKRRGLDGAQSIALAFLTAGSRAVVSSLWMVDDAAAAELMATFHRERRRTGATTAEALRTAQLRWLAGSGTPESESRRGTAPKLKAPGAAARADRRHPFYWAPFVTTGAR